MIQIVQPKKRKQKINPHYILTYDYMIGDANGSTEESAGVSLDNPHIERYVTLLDKLKPCKGSWGIQLNSEDIYGNFKEGRITEDDYNFLMRIMFMDEISDFDELDEEATKNEVIAKYFKTPKENKFADELSFGIKSDTEYSFLVFRGATLQYQDENGKIFETKIVK